MEEDILKSLHSSDTERSTPESKAVGEQDVMMVMSQGGGASSDVASLGSHRKMTEDTSKTTPNKEVRLISKMSLQLQRPTSSQLDLESRESRPRSGSSFSVHEVETEHGQEAEPEVLIDGSLSEESGVYTQTSSDSRFRHGSDIGSKVHLTVLSRMSAIDPEEYKVGSESKFQGPSKQLQTNFKPYLSPVASNLPRISLPPSQTNPSAVVSGSNSGPDQGSLSLPLSLQDDQQLLGSRDSWGDTSSMATVVTAVHRSRSSGSDVSSSTRSQNVKDMGDQSNPSLSTPQSSLEESNHSPQRTSPSTGSSTVGTGKEVVASSISVGAMSGGTGALQFSGEVLDNGDGSFSSNSTFTCLSDTESDFEDIYQTNVALFGDKETGLVNISDSNNNVEDFTC